MGKSNNKNIIPVKAIAILIIISLLLTPVTVTADTVALSTSVKVTLNLNGGSAKGANTSITSKDGTYSPLKFIADPTKKGYKFAGWFSTKSGGTKLDHTSDLIENNNHSIYAHWTGKKYKVTFKGNGGKASSKSMTVQYGKAYGTLPTASKNGYGFTGWYTSKGKKIVSTTNYTTIGNTTLYAKWAKKRKITFSPNGGDVSTKSKIVLNGKTYGTLPTPTRKGYLFSGWYTKKSGGIKIVYNKKVRLSKNTILYAKWKQSKFTVKFNANGGNILIKSKKVTYNKKYGIMPTPVRTGYNFDGWYVDSIKGMKVTSSTIYKQTKGQTLFARWSPKNIKVQFDGNGGKSSLKYKTVKYDSAYGDLPAPSRSNYKFLGWYTSKISGSKISSTTKMKYTTTRTLYARWAKISTVTFNYRNGVKGIANKKIVFGENYGKLPKSTRPNYTLRGWYNKKYGGTRVKSTTKVTGTKNSILYAQWEWNMSVKKMYAVKGSKARPGTRRNGFAGVTIHNTGNSSASADALNHANYLLGSGANKSASWHYCVDDKIATQSIPENEKAWHAGDGSSGKGNSKTIAIEICMNDGGDLLDATENGAKLAADILHRNGVSKAVSGINLHQHNFFSSYGKNCPEKIRSGDPYSWATFVKRVNFYLDKM